MWKNFSVLIALVFIFAATAKSSELNYLLSDEARLHGTYFSKNQTSSTFERVKFNQLDKTLAQKVLTLLDKRYEQIRRLPDMGIDSGVVIKQTFKVFTQNGQQMGYMVELYDHIQHPHWGDSGTYLWFDLDFTLIDQYEWEWER